MRSAGAVAASLAAFELAGCSKPQALGRGGSSSSTSRSGQGGTYNTPPSTDVEHCAVHLGGDGEFVFDVHTHYATPTGPWVRDAPATVGLILGMVPASCTDGDRLDCVDETVYLHDVFLASDTTMAMLTDVPNSGVFRRARALCSRASYPVDREGIGRVRRRTTRLSKRSSLPMSDRSKPA